MTIIATVPTAIGSGAIGAQAASTSELAFDSSSPGGVPLVPGQRQPEVLPGHRAAVVGLHAVLHDAGAPAAGDDADAAQDRHPDEERDDRDQRRRSW